MLFGGVIIYLCGKSRFVCAHIGQNRDIYPPSIFRLYFDSRHPPPFPQVEDGGCYREKFFYFFFVTSFLFGFVLDFIQNICSFNSLQVFTRHSSSASFYIHHVWISRFQTLNYDSFLPVEFYSHQFDLFQHCRFYALTLLLVINKHLCLCEFVLCLFWLF